MRYFAMIDGERRGPFEIERLAEEGVRPDTYVWCRGMADWEKAEDVAEICRFYRRRIFDLMHPSPEHSQPEPIADAKPEPSRFELPPVTMEPDTSSPPAPTLFLALFLTLFCFPVTGLVAIYYSYKARVAWQESQRSRSENSNPLYTDAEREKLRVQAHDYDRQARMWIGITFFLGIIFYAFLGHKFM